MRGTNNYRRYWLIWLSCFALLHLGIAGVNLTVDPSAAFGTRLAPGLENHRRNNSRIAKARQLGRGDWDVVLLGTSRVESGFDPASGAWNGARVYNGGLADTDMQELESALHYTLAHGPPRTLVLCLELRLFDENGRVNGYYFDSPFNPELNEASYYADCLFSYGQTGRSVETLVRYLGTNTATDESLSNGLRRRTAPLKNQRHVFGKLLGFQFHHPKNPNPTPFQWSEKKREAYQRMVAACAARDVQLIVVLSPVHALLQECYWRLGTWDDFEHLKQMVVEVTEAVSRRENYTRFEIWDFTGYRGPTTERVPAWGSDQQMRWYFEPSHFTPALGDRIAARLMRSGDPDDFGVQLGSHNFAQVLAEIRQQREEYLAAHADQIAWLDEIQQRVEKKHGRKKFSQRPDDHLEK